MFKNLLTLTDSYKVTHWPQYPKGTDYLYAYWESRGGLYPETVFYGLQYLLKEYLSRPITMEDIDSAQKRFERHFANSHLFNRDGWLYILKM